MVGSSVVTIAFGDEFILPALHSDIDSDFSSIFFLYIVLETKVQHTVVTILNLKKIGPF